MDRIEISKSENLLVYKSQYSIEFVKKTITEQRLNGLLIFDYLDVLNSLDFLKDYTFLKYLSITCMDDHDYGFLKQLGQLQWLTLGSSVTNHNEIDLSSQTNLEFLSIAWRKKLKGINHCQKLKSIFLMDFKESDLSFIGKLTSLKQVVIKTASIKSLNGLENLKNLEMILLGNCRYLKSLSVLNKMPDLKKLILDTCSKIEDFDLLVLPSLEELRILSCKTISTIKFINNSPVMKILRITATEIADGDLMPVLRIKEVFYPNRDHYNVPYPPPNVRTF